MPVSIAALKISLGEIGGTKHLAAVNAPYVKSDTYGFETDDRDSGTALIAAMIVFHEASDMSFQSPKDLDRGELVRQIAKAKKLKKGSNTDVGATDATDGKSLHELTEELNNLEYRIMIQSNIDSKAAASAYIDMVGCQQVKPLKESNIENYFRMLDVASEDMPQDLLKYVQYFARSNPGIANLPEFEQRITTQEWVYYHASASQNGRLVIAAAESAPVAKDGSVFFEKNELDAAKAHADCSLSLALARAIPKSALIKAYAVLESLKALPSGEWYMGKKAMESYPKSKYGILVNALKIHNKALAREMVPDEEEQPHKIAQKINELVESMTREDGTKGKGGREDVIVGEGRGDDDGSEGDEGGFAMRETGASSEYSDSEYLGSGNIYDPHGNNSYGDDDGGEAGEGETTMKTKTTPRKKKRVAFSEMSPEHKRRSKRRKTDDADQGVNVESPQIEDLEGGTEEDIRKAWKEKVEDLFVWEPEKMGLGINARRYQAEIEQKIIVQYKNMLDVQKKRDPKNVFVPYDVNDVRMSYREFVERQKRRAAGENTSDSDSNSDESDSKKSTQHQKLLDDGTAGSTTVNEKRGERDDGNAGDDGNAEDDDRSDGELREEEMLAPSPSIASSELSRENPSSTARGAKRATRSSRSTRRG